jgi:hypothetical protein
MKACNKCKATKLATDFYANKRMKDGLNSFCILCHKADNLVRKQRNRSDLEFIAAEKAQKAEYRKRTSEHNKQYMQEWRCKNSEQQSEYRKQYHNANKEYFIKYRQANKALINARTRRRQMSLINRTPAWLDTTAIAEIYSIYEYCSALRNIGLRYEVDHIIPLQGKLVSGLHIPENLQVIHEFDNRSKSNKLTV